jgi:hypothetical protein
VKNKLKEKEKMRKASKIGVIVLLILMFASISAAVYADVQVYIRNPLSSDAKGVTAGGYWVGEIPITACGDCEDDQQTTAYCMNFTKTLYVGNTYPAGTAPVQISQNGKLSATF